MRSLFIHMSTARPFRLGPWRTPFLAIALVLLACCSTQAGDFAQRVFEEANLARTNPKAYAATLAANPPHGCNLKDLENGVSFLERTAPVGPLRWSPGLARAAQAHVDAQGPKGSIGHSGSGAGSSPWDRISKQGKWVSVVSENIDYGSATAREMICAWIVDAGIRGKGHRVNLFNPAYHVTGVATGMHARYRTMCVMEYAGDFIEGQP